MGNSTDEIGRQIADTRDRVDENLTILEQRAAANARRIAIIIVIGVATGVVVGGVAYLVYRRMRRRSSARGRTAMWASALRTAAPAVVTSLVSGAVARAIAARKEAAARVG